MTDPVVTPATCARWRNTPLGAIAERVEARAWLGAQTWQRARFWSRRELARSCE